MKLRKLEQNETDTHTQSYTCLIIDIRVVRFNKRNVKSLKENFNIWQ